MMVCHVVLALDRHVSLLYLPNLKIRAPDFLSNGVSVHKVAAHVWLPPIHLEYMFRLFYARSRTVRLIAPPYTASAHDDPSP